MFRYHAGAKEGNPWHLSLIEETNFKKGNRVPGVTQALATLMHSTAKFTYKLQVGEGDMQKRDIHSKAADLGSQILLKFKHLIVGAEWHRQM